LTFVDLAPRFREWYADPTRPGLDIPVDGHPNAAAHALIAEELEKVVAPLLVEDLK
jgi:lysophospholipase L1-like esterase